MPADILLLSEKSLWPHGCKLIGDKISKYIQRYVESFYFDFRAERCNSFLFFIKKHSFSSPGIGVAVILM